MKLEVIDGARSRASQIDLANIVTWTNRIAELRRYVERIAPRVLETLERGESIEVGDHFATLEPPVEVNGVRYRVLKINGATCYVTAEGSLHSMELAFCRIRGGV